jgi:type I restriction enzyme, S subunit
VLSPRTAGPGLVAEVAASAAVKFGDVVRQIKATVDPQPAQRYVAGEHMETGQLHIDRWGVVGEGYLGPAFHRLFQPGQVLYGSRRTYLRKVAVADFEGICANTTFVCEPADDRLMSELLPFVMLTDAFNEHSMDQSKGSVNPYVNWSDLAWFEFPLPSRAMQLRIAKVLTAAEASLRSYEEALARAQVARNTALRDWLSADGSPRPGWKLSPLGEHFRLASGSTPKRSLHDRYFAGGTTPWVKTLDLTEGEVTGTAEHITQTALQETSCKLMPPGTVMVAMYGGFNQIGRTGLLRIEAATNQAVCCLIPPATVTVLPEYALLCLQANRHAWRRVAASSRKDPNITKRDVTDFVIPVPPTLAEQDDICSRVDAFDRLIASLKTAHATALTVRQQLANELLSNQS